MWSKSVITKRNWVEEVQISDYYIILSGVEGLKVQTVIKGFQKKILILYTISTLGLTVSFILTVIRL